MTTTDAASRRRRDLRRGRRARRWTAVLFAVLPVLGGAGCQVAGSAIIAPYRSPPLLQVTARALAAAAGVLALSPDGTLLAVVDHRRGVCFRAPGAAPDHAVCTDVPPGGSATISASFSPDGRWVALGQDVSVQGRGRVWLVDPRTGHARAVPTDDGRPARGVATYTEMVWEAAGNLLLIANSMDADGLLTRLVDVDPVSLVPRVVAQATGPYEFQSGDLATGGSTVLFTVFLSDQLQPNVVDIDLGSGARREVGPIGAAGTRLVPLAVSPDGRVAVVGSDTLEHPGPPRLLDVASGKLTDVPSLGGDFGVAAFSPDGARVAVVSTDADGTASLALVALGAPLSSAVPGTAPLQPARTLGRFRVPLPRGARLSWSRFDVLSLTGPASTGSASVNGWALST